jgi:hypothetical protein
VAMLKGKEFLCLSLLVSGFMIAGCAPLVVGGAAVGAGSGTYLYLQGDLRTDYYYSFDQVWNACEKTIADMKAREVVPIKEISEGRINAMINDEKVQFYIKYKDKNVTTVGIRVGVVGDEAASKRLQDKVSENLTRK